MFPENTFLEKPVLLQYYRFMLATWSRNHSFPQLSDALASPSSEPQLWGLSSVVGALVSALCPREQVASMLPGTCSRPLVTGQSIFKRCSPGGNWALLGTSITELVYLLGCYWVPLRVGASFLCISQFQILWVLNSSLQFFSFSYF